MVKSKRSTLKNKPAKPYRDFPLTPHNNGTWCKSIKGRLFYFGRWDDPHAALAEYQRVAADLHAGRVPKAVRQPGEGLPLGDACNAYLSHQQRSLEAGELAPRSFQDNYQTCAVLVGHFGRARIVEGLTAADFERLRAVLAKRYGPVRLGNVIQRIRSVFKYAFDSDLIDKPVKFGPGFKRPNKKTLRLARAAKGSRVFSRVEIHALLKAAKQPLRAMILLAMNGGLGNSDCASMSLDHLDLAGGWLDYPRVKTGIPRRIPLWPETVSAIEEALASRPEPKDESNARLVFVTRFGGPWITTRVSVPESDGQPVVPHVSRDDSVTKEFRKLARKLGLNGERGFYSLRHSFRTVADGAKDQVAANALMGHVDPTMAGVYRESVEDERLEAVVNHVREWLFGTDKAVSK